MQKVFYTTIAAFMVALSLNAQTTAQTPSVKTEEIVTKRVIIREMEKTINGKKMEVTFKNDEVTALKVDGKNVPKASWSKFQTEIDELRSSAIAMDHDPEQGANSEVKILSAEDADLSAEQKATQVAIENELISDNLIEKDKSYKLMLSEKSMSVNGKTVSQGMLDKYISIYYTNSGEQRCEKCQFKMQLNKRAK